MNDFSKSMHVYLLLISGVIIPSLSPDFTLKSVHIVIRHGDRSPLHTVPGIANQHLACSFSGPFHNSVPNAVDYLRVMKARGVRKAGASYAGVAMYPSSETCDIGDLTPNGALQHLQLGSFLRRRYINIHQLFDGMLEDFTGKVGENCGLCLKNYLVQQIVDDFWLVITRGVCNWVS